MRKKMEGLIYDTPYWCSVFKAHFVGWRVVKLLRAHGQRVNAEIVGMWHFHDIRAAWNSLHGSGLPVDLAALYRFRAGSSGISLGI